MVEQNERHFDYDDCACSCGSDYHPFGCVLLTNERKNMEMIDNGGPAFTDKYGMGVSMRDYFAVHASPMPDWWFKLWHAKEVAKARRDDRYIMRGEMQANAEWQYECADNMLKARKEGR